MILELLSVVASWTRVEIVWFDVNVLNTSLLWEMPLSSTQVFLTPELAKESVTLISKLDLTISFGFIISV